MRARAAITVWKPRAEVYARWRELLAQDDGPLRLAPAEVLDEAQGDRLAWRAERASGVARFLDAPQAGGTEIHLEIDESVLGGPLGVVVRKAAGSEPLQQAKDDLRRFKQLLETGEVVVSGGTPEGHSAARHLAQRAAQPLGSAGAGGGAA